MIMVFLALGELQYDDHHDDPLSRVACVPGLSKYSVFYSINVTL